jgi:3-oxoacyl-[acyl-carrier protein] reductase
MADLRGKIALVTGGGRGIGRAVAVALARAGADVAVNFKTREKEARATLEEIFSTGRKGAMVRADVSQASEAMRLVATAEKDLGPIDILVNNAGIARHQKLEETTEKDWDEVIQINLKSVFLVTQAALPGMRRRGWGRIINITSGATQTGGLVGIHYTASKSGVEGLTRAYALRLVKEGITVNAVAPVLIQTDMTDMNQDKEGLTKIIPIGRLGRPEEVADAVLLLAGNGYITGQTIHLAGGLYCH